MRGSAGMLVFVVPGLAAAAGSCTDSRFSLGESCLRDEDCLSGVCAQQYCVAAPPLLDGMVNGIEDSGDDALQEAAIDSAPTVDSSVDVFSDEGTRDVVAEKEAAGGFDATEFVADAPAEAAADGSDGAPSDAPSDAPADAPPDAPADASVDAQLDSSADGAEGG